jgi:HEAT repeat protein
MALVFLLLLLIFQILWLRASHNSRITREKHFLTLWRPLLMSEISGNATTYPPLKTRDAEFFLNLWNHFQESLKGPARERLNDLAIETGMADRARAMLQKKGLRQRLMALATLGNLQDRFSWNDILALTREQDRTLSLSAFSALLRIDARHAISTLKPQLADRKDWPPAQLAILIQESGALEATSMLVDYAQEVAHSSHPADVQRLQRLLQLMVISPSHEKLLAVRTILETATDSEVIAQCMKLLNAPEDLPKIRTYAGHPDWVVRLQAALALGRIGSTDDLPLLLKLLCDPDWSVRRRSADAIIRLVRMDENRLAELLAAVADPFARDMLSMALAESRMK